MKLAKEVNLLENPRIIMRLNVASLAVCIGIFVSYWLLDVSIRFEFSLLGFVIFILVMMLSFALHEVIHGLFFWLFNKQQKVKYGYKNGMLYATSPGSFYTKKAFLIIALGPFIGLTLLYLAIGLVYPSVAYQLFAIHTAGCVGDFYYVYLLAKKPKKVWVEDTEVGISFYYQTEGGQ